MGDLQSEEKRDVVLELTIDVVPLPHNDTKQKLLTARVDYFNVITNKLASSTGELGVFRPGKSRGAVKVRQTHPVECRGQSNAAAELLSSHSTMYFVDCFATPLKSVYKKNCI